MPSRQRPRWREFFAGRTKKAAHDREGVLYDGNNQENDVVDKESVEVPCVRGRREGELSDGEGEGTYQQFVSAVREEAASFNVIAPLDDSPAGTHELPMVLPGAT